MSDFEPRFPGQDITFETRRDSHDTVDKRKRYQQILECLREFGPLGLTAKECAEIMYQKGYIPTNERNFTAPRLTEMAQAGMVEPIGKQTCRWTGKKVTVYARKC